MMFGLFRRKDPVCGMKEEKGKGIEKESKWFCSKDCMKKYETRNEPMPAAGKYYFFSGLKNEHI